MRIGESPSDSLEDLLQKKEDIQQETVENISSDKKCAIQTAEGNASMFDFIKMVFALVSKTMQDLNVEFVPDENKNIVENPDLQMDHPVITYKVIHRKPKIELKPRVRQQITEKGDNPGETRVGEVYGQKFECLIQFDIFASVYGTAEEVMERFEDLIFIYTGSMKKRGIAEIVFDEQLTDRNFDMFRQTISVRSLRYKVEVERLRILFQDKIKEVESIVFDEKEA
jgi:hypothetical protein